MESTIKRKALSVSEKVAIVKELQSGEKNSAVCKKYGLSSSTVSTIWKNREVILSAFEKNLVNTKKFKKCEKEDLDKALLCWFKSQRDARFPINGPILKIQAEKFAVKLGYSDFTCNNGWLDRFKNRHNIVYAQMSGEKLSVDMESVSDWVKNVWPTLLSEYEENDIFNADEAGLFYKLTPNKTFKFKGENCAGGKLSKERITVLVCANMTGTEKRKLLVIGKSLKPRCFNNANNIPVSYTANRKAWMTAQIFSNELTKWDLDLQRKHRKVLLFVDNCPAHPAIVPNLKNIKLAFLPPNATSVLQPMDQGVIRSFKCFYRRFLILLLIEKMERKLKPEVNLLESIYLLHDAWESVTNVTIQKCFEKAGLKKKCTDESNISDSEDEDDVVIPLSEWLRKRDLNSYQDCPLDDYEIVDNEIETTGHLTEDEILQGIMEQPHNDDSDSENSAETSTPVTCVEAKNALETLMRFYENRPNDERIQMALGNLRRDMRDAQMNMPSKQTKLTDFFNNC